MVWVGSPNRKAGEFRSHANTISRCDFPCFDAEASRLQSRKELSELTGRAFGPATQMFGVLQAELSGPSGRPIETDSESFYDGYFLNIFTTALSSNCMFFCEFF